MRSYRVSHLYSCRETPLSIISDRRNPSSYSLFFWSPRFEMSHCTWPSRRFRRPTLGAKYYKAIDPNPSIYYRACLLLYLGMFQTISLFIRFTKTNIEGRTKKKLHIMRFSGYLHLAHSIINDCRLDYPAKLRVVRQRMDVMMDTDAPAESISLQNEEIRALVGYFLLDAW